MLEQVVTRVVYIECEEEDKVIIEGKNDHFSYWMTVIFKLMI